jgi:hypothetical protein
MHSAADYGNAAFVTIALFVIAMIIDRFYG